MARDCSKSCSACSTYKNDDHKSNEEDHQDNRVDY